MRALAVLLLLGGCATCKPDIPDDSIVVCYQGQVHILSKSAGQALRLPLSCGDPERRV